MGNKSINVNVELRISDDGKFKAYLSDDIGGSGIKVSDYTADGISKKIMKEIGNYIDELYCRYEQYL